MPKKLLKIASTNEVPLGGAIKISLTSGMEIALFNIDGTLHALDNFCPHQGGPLVEGEIDGCFVTCPWHAWRFDIRDGFCENMPSENAQSLPLRIIGEEVFLEIEIDAS